MLDQYHIDKKRARASFGRAAETYDAAAILQKLVRDEMLSRLDLVNINPHTILDAGCGTGAGSQALQKRFTKAQVVSLDFAMPMLQKTRSTKRQSGLMHQVKSIFGNANSHCLCADIEALPLVTASIGLLWSNLAIQWCNDLDVALQEFHRVLQPEGLLMFSTFGPDTLKELRVATAQENTTSVRHDLRSDGDIHGIDTFDHPIGVFDPGSVGQAVHAVTR